MIKFIIKLTVLFPSSSVTSSDQERSCILLMRLQAAGGTWRWVHCVLQLKDAAEATGVAATNASATISPSAASTSQSATPNVSSPASGSTSAQPSTSSQTQQQPIIVATNQVLSEREAAVLRSNTWLYHYYTMQSKLQYGLTYEAQRVHPYYPQVVPHQPAENTTSYIPNNPLASSYYHQQFSQSTQSSHYNPLNTSYLHPYHAHYSLRLHSEYSRDPSQSYFDYSNQAAHNYVYNYNTNAPQPITTSPLAETMSPAPSITPKSRRSTPTASPKRSPISHSHSQGHVLNDTSGGVALATPVAVRPSPPCHTKGPSPMSVDETDLTWKSSPSQEVPDCPEYTPYVTPPYSTMGSPAKPIHFSFDNSPEPSDQFVPASHIDPREVPWYSHAFVK